MANVTKVEFYNGATKLGEVLSPPYTFNWVGATEGAKALKAIAILDDATQVESPITNITVNADTGVPAYTADPLLSPYMTEVGIANDGTGYFDATPQATTGAKWWYDVNKLIEDLEAATGTSDLSTVFGGIYTKYGGGGNLDRIEHELIAPTVNLITAPNGVGTIDETGVRLNTINDTTRYHRLHPNADTMLDADGNNDGYGAFIVIGSNEAPLGYGSGWVNGGSGDFGLQIYAETDKVVKGRINGRLAVMQAAGGDLRGCWAITHDSSRAASEKERYFKDGTLITSAAEGISLGIPAASLREGSHPAGSYWYSNQLHLISAYTKVQLTDQQVTDISQALLDFETRTGRKTW